MVRVAGCAEAVPADGIRLHVDHVMPLGKGGETVLENLQVLCSVCNIGKGDIEPRN
ncbi:MAG: HNH endonuclease [Candidatus Acidiferrales bacterium]